MSISINQAESQEVLIKQTYSSEVADNRKADFPVHSLFLNRWSPRAYSDSLISEETLYTVLEAARWTPSASNEQPWRFYIARTEAEHDVFHQFIMPRNLLWASKAPVLILVASVKVRENGDVNGAHAFDTGAAWGSIAFQAHLLGLSTRAIGGFDHNVARELLQVPEHIQLHAVIALGYKGDPAALDESFQQLEKPNNRRKLSDSILPIQGS